MSTVNARKPKLTALLNGGDSVEGDTYFDLVAAMWMEGFDASLSIDEYMHAVVVRLSQLGVVECSNMYFLPNEIGFQTFISYLQSVGILELKTTVSGRRR